MRCCVWPACRYCRNVAGCARAWRRSSSAGACWFTAPILYGERSEMAMTGNIRSNRRFLAAQIVAFVAGLALTIPTEVMKFRAAAGTKLGLWAWFFWLDHDTTFAFVLLLIAPAFWFVRRLPSWLRIRERDGSAPLDHGRSRPSGSERTTTKAARDAPVGRSIDVSAWIMAAACALASIVASAWIASLDVEVEKEQPPMHFGDLPPDIHD